MTCPTSLFMGDVVADDDYTFTVNDGVVTATISIPKGSWFANAYVFWLYVVVEHGNMALDYLKWENEELSLYFAGSITVTWTSGAGNMIAEVGGDFGTAVNTDPLPSTWNTLLPLIEYTRAVEIHGSSTQRAQDGTSYTVSGVPHETRQLATAIDHRTGSYEEALLLAIHRSHWRVGRSVSFYPESIISTAGAIWAYLGDKSLQYGDEGSGRFESLVLPVQDQTRWRPKRLVECKDVINLEDGTKFYVRQPVPLSDPTAILYRIP
jgi:hypothetical protein